MAKEFEFSLWNYMKDIKWGEYVVIKHTSSDPTHLLFYILIRQLQEDNTPFIIVDVLDKLHLFKTHLMAAGIDTSIVNDIPVIKLGGIKHTGNIMSLIERVDISQDIPIWTRHYREALHRVEERFNNYIKIIVGVDALLQLYEENIWDLNILMLSGFANMLGDKRSKGFIFLNYSTLKSTTILKLEEIFTRILSVGLEENTLTLRIEKSINFSEYRKEIKVNAQELQDYLIGPSPTK